MHAIAFALKRVHHRILFFSRYLLRAFRALGLTPARFDMMYAINGSSSLDQRGLCTKLGVTAPTVSRMLDSLEDRGIIVRMIPSRDRRRRYLRLTEHGARLFRRAYRATIRSSAMDRLIDIAFTMTHDPETKSGELLIFEGVLHYAKRRLLDRATLIYPFHPDS